MPELEMYIPINASDTTYYNSFYDRLNMKLSSTDNQHEIFFMGNLNSGNGRKEIYIIKLYDEDIYMQICTSYKVLDTKIQISSSTHGQQTTKEDQLYTI